MVLLWMLGVAVVLLYMLDARCCYGIAVDGEGKDGARLWIRGSDLMCLLLMDEAVRPWIISGVGWQGVWSGNCWR